MMGRDEGALALARWYTLWDPKAKIVWLEPGNWSQGRQITWEECAQRIMNGVPGTPVAQLRDGILCGDFDYTDGIERMERACEDLNFEVCYYIQVESGRPGHAHLFVLSLGTPSEEIAAILKKHGADVRGRSAMRLPGTPNRNGNRGRVLGDLIEHQREIKEFITKEKPKFSQDASRFPRRDDSSKLDRSAAIQSHILECRKAGYGLDLALETILREKPIGYDKITRRSQHKQEKYVAKSFMKALAYNGRQAPSIDIDGKINAWEGSATSTIQANITGTTRATGLRVAQGIARIAQRCGKTQGLSLSCRELAEEVGMNQDTIHRYLKTLCRLKLIKRDDNQEREGGWAQEYSLNESVEKNDTPGGRGGAVNTGCLISLHFTEDGKNYFGGSSQKWFVYEAILQLTALNGGTTVREIVTLLGLDPKRGRDSVCRHVRDLARSKLIKREGHTLTRGDASPRECAEARGTHERMQKRRTRHANDRISLWKKYRKKGLSVEETEAMFPPMTLNKMTPEQEHTLTPYPVEIEAAPAAPAQRDWMNLGERMNA